MVGCQNRSVGDMINYIGYLPNHLFHFLRAISVEQNLEQFEHLFGDSDFLLVFRVGAVSAACCRLLLGILSSCRNAAFRTGCLEQLEGAERLIARTAACWDSGSTKNKPPA